MIFQDKYTLKNNFKITILLNITQGGEKNGWPIIIIKKTRDNHGYSQN